MLIEPHGLVVQHGGSERRKVMAFQEGAGIGDESKTGGVRFRKSIEREGRNGLNDPVLRGSGNSLRLHSTAQFDLPFFHPGLRAFESEGPAKFFGFPARKSSRDHGHAKKLLLKARHSERA